jgi:hypothetical protein
VNRCTGKIGETILVFIDKFMEGFEVFMVTVNTVKRFEETFFLFLEIVVQLGLVDSKITQMDDTGNRMAKNVFSVLNLLVYNVVIAVGVGNDKYHQRLPACPVKS